MTENLENEYPIARYGNACIPDGSNKAWDMLFESEGWRLPFRVKQNIDILENDKLYNYIPYFEKAHLYLQKSTNLFQSLGVEEHERIYIEGAKYNDFENSKHLRDTTKIAKELYHEGYLLLYNLSLRLNKRWKEEPNVFTKEIVLDHPLPNDKNNSKYYDFYM